MKVIKLGLAGPAETSQLINFTNFILHSLEPADSGVDPYWRGLVEYTYFVHLIFSNANLYTSLYLSSFNDPDFIVVIRVVIVTDAVPSAR